MSKLRITCLLALVLGAFVAVAAAAEQKAAEKKATAPGPEWKLVWSDEFDKDGSPDPAKWRHEEGFIRNHEAQYYTKRPENVRVENGNLVIEARKEKFKNPKFRPGASARQWQASREYAEYTAGSINTKTLASWTYGRIEVRAQLPEGKGQWPAIWTLGVEGGWPKNGESDIMEWWGYKPQTIYSTMHYSLGGKHKSNQGKIPVGDAKAFHVYTEEWSAETIDFYFDGVKYFSFPVATADEGTYNPYRHAHYLLLNLALGGDAGGKIDDSKFPQKYLIDYVRVYQKK